MSVDRTCQIPLFSKMHLLHSLFLQRSLSKAESMAIVKWRGVTTAEADAHFPPKQKYPPYSEQTIYPIPGLK